MPGRCFSSAKTLRKSQVLYRPCCTDVQMAGRRFSAGSKSHGNSGLQALGCALWTQEPWAPTDVQTVGRCFSSGNLSTKIVAFRPWGMLCGPKNIERQPEKPTSGLVPLLPLWRGQSRQMSSSRSHTISGGRWLCTLMNMSSCAITSSRQSDESTRSNSSKVSRGRSRPAHVMSS